MDTPFNMIIAGMTVCGKTYYLLNMLENEYKGHFDYIFKFAQHTIITGRTLSPPQRLLIIFTYTGLHGREIIFTYTGLHEVSAGRERRAGRDGKRERKEASAR